MSIDLLLYVASFILALLAAFNVSSPRVNLLALAFALFVLTFIV